MIPAHVLTARALIGRGWRHRGRGPLWFDCLGLVVTAFAANGRPLPDREDYGREPVRDGLRPSLEAEFGPPITRAPEPGDVFLMRGWAYPLHVGLFGDYALGGLSLIHASNQVGVMKVCEQRLDAKTEARIVAVFDWQGVG